MKTKRKQALSTLDHMILSAGGRTPDEFELQNLRSVESAPGRRFCRTMAQCLTSAASWFDAQGRVVREG